MGAERPADLLTSGASRLEPADVRRIALDEPGSAFLVESGAVDVFGYETREGEQRGARHHLFRAETGDLIAGIRDGRGEIRLVGAGTPGAAVARLAAGRLERLLAGPRESPGIGALLERWVVHLSASLALGPPPRRFRDAVRGTAFDLEPGGVLRSTDVVWIRASQGEVRILGERPSPGEEAAFPLTAATWAVASSRAGGTVRDTSDLLEEGSFPQHLEAFHILFVDLLRDRFEKLGRARREVFETRQRRERQGAARAFRALASVLEKPSATPLEADAVEDELLQACQLVGKAQGIVIRGPREESPAARAGDPLHAIAKASRVRFRLVALRGAWWSEDNGPLLGYRLPGGEAGTKRPVALLPVSATSYEMVDPVEGTRVPVTPPVASGVDGFAAMFFRPLPESGVTGKSLWRLGLSDSRGDLWTLLLMGLAGGLLGLLVPVVTGYFFGTVIPGAQRGPLAQVTAGLFVSALSASLFEITRSIATLRIEGRLDNVLQSAVWDRLLSLPVAFFRNYTVGDLATRAMAIGLIRQVLTGSTVTMALSATFSAFNVLLLYYYSWKLALLASACMIVVLGVSLLLTYRQLRSQREVQTVQGKISGFVLQVLNAIAKLHVSAAEDRAFSVWSGQFRRQRSLSVAARRTGNLLTAFSSVAPLLMSIAVFSYLHWSLLEEGGFDTGDFLAFNSALGQFLAASLSIVGVFSSALTVVPLYERLKPILETSPEVDSSKADPGELSGRLELSHVSFRYGPETPLVLDDVSFQARPGEFIAFAGPSGSGKSTLLRLVLGFETPSTGEVRFDGLNLAGLDVQAVRSQIGVVLQGGRLMVGDVFSNIVGASSRLTLADAWEAARMAGLEADIRAMPMGMQTAISEGAGTISGGQRQRLMIARAIVHKPRILLFDEATSALDNRTQRIVSESLEGLAATRIVIAHRLSTIRNADRIYTVQAGRIVQAGSYDELMRQGGPFVELVRRQIA